MKFYKGTQHTYSQKKGRYYEDLQECLMLLEYSMNTVNLKNAGTMEIHVLNQQVPLVHTQQQHLPEFKAPIRRSGPSHTDGNCIQCHAKSVP